MSHAARAGAVRPEPALSSTEASVDANVQRIIEQIRKNSSAARISNAGTEESLGSLCDLGEFADAQYGHGSEQAEPSEAEEGEEDELEDEEYLMEDSSGEAERQHAAWQAGDQSTWREAAVADDSGGDSADHSHHEGIHDEYGTPQTRGYMKQLARNKSGRMPKGG